MAYQAEGTHHHRALFENMPRALGVKRFRPELDERNLYTLENQRARPVSDPDILLYVFPNSAWQEEIPSGYVLVGGANYNSYVHIYNTGNLLPDYYQDSYSGELRKFDYARRGHSELLLARSEDLVDAQ